MKRRIMHIDCELIEIVHERAPDLEILEDNEKRRLEKYKTLPSDRELVERVIKRYIRIKDRRVMRGT
jgi:hypothetical protein